VLADSDGNTSAVPKRGERDSAAKEAGHVYVDAAVDVPVRTAFSYRLPEALVGRVQPGDLLYVPFRGRPRAALALRLLAEHELEVPDGVRIETVIDRLGERAALPPRMVELLDWVARYYYAPPGEVVRLMLPKQLRVRGRRLVRATPFGVRCRQSELLSDVISEQVVAELEAAGRPLSAKALRRSVRGLTLARITELADRGVLEVRYQSVDPKRGRKTVSYLERVGDPPPGRRLGARQAAVLDLLKGRSRVLEAEARELTGASYATVRSLVKNGWVKQTEVEQIRDPFEGEAPLEIPLVTLTGEQEAAATAVIGDGTFESFRSLVLHGVTGSGKTEVYLTAIGAALDAGKRALVLLPEIALTPQLVGIFRARFSDAVAVLHSGLSDGQRFDQWRRIRRGQVQVVIGARSAVFAPLEALGIIVVDEEHDGSFKQDSGVRYNARDLALVRGQLEGATVVLGSATPSLESRHRCEDGRSPRLLLSERPTGQPLPEVEIVDLREVPVDPDTGRRPLLSPRLREQLERSVERGEQAILFLNRRGHSPAVVCASCGNGWECPHCEITLTFHRRAARLRCHYCDYAEALPERCPQCQSPEWLFLGAGTEKLSDQLAGELGGALRVGRLDSDTASGGRTRDIIRSFREHQFDVLVGTQMVTKGHDFPRVTLVGVVMADLSLRLPDFRSGERTFQLLAQVAGRAGRADRPGRVIVQTYLPDHPVIVAASRHDYDRFAQDELSARRALGYPPFGYLIALRIEGGDLDRVIETAGRLRRAAAAIASSPAFRGGKVGVLGPVESPLARIRGRHRWQMLLRSPSRRPLRDFTNRLLGASGVDDGARERVALIVDVDPISLM
jgi:primosomal protein N' (replication factor Y)